jgi:hypothetical protein
LAAEENVVPQTVKQSGYTDIAINGVAKGGMVSLGNQSKKLILETKAGDTFEIIANAFVQKANESIATIPEQVEDRIEGHL